MNISLKLGTDNFLKNQLTSADTLLKPLFDSNGDHLLIKELTSTGDYKGIKGELDLSKEFYLLVYIKLNNEQMSLFEDKVYNKYPELVEKDNDPAIFRNHEDFHEFLLINSFKREDDLDRWKKLIYRVLKDGIQKSSAEPLGFFTKSYQLEEL
ncbi:hypothetical protein [Companilactobacillus ginsenosidimutans]|uniref:Uncharacterized protein n=1 Tax=Companilactobacillus ginsenosidimutans TaxID=1007676 RepID=A0A0H4QM29_9LACO|nr:hypothetical protein [Companilactobacillus ginsenosidimutans]AKP68171.1 hypothetical protein ABM34_11925 [Companilactobacillus ginsenosidimutans]